MNDAVVFTFESEVMAHSCRVVRSMRVFRAAHCARKLWDVHRYAEQVNETSGVLIFDGDCGFCARWATWVVDQWSPGQGHRAIASQLVDGEFAAAARLTADELSRSAWWVEGERRDEGPRAVARSLISTGWPWAVAGRFLLLPPFSWLAPLGYRVVSRFRYLLPGSTPACRAGLRE